MLVGAQRQPSRVQWQDGSVAVEWASIALDDEELEVPLTREPSNKCAGVAWCKQVLVSQS